MAGDWIKMRTDLAEDPAVIAMAATLGVDEDVIVGKLHRLWSWADRQSRDGHASGVTNVWIDRYIRHDGFANAMVSVRWLVIDEAGVTFPKFDIHNGETAKTRALGAKRKQKQRASDTDAVTPPVPNVSRSQRDKSVTREEKRREEKKDQKKEQKHSSTDKPPTPPADLLGHKAERLAQVTADAIAAFNALLGKPHGLLPAVSARVGTDKRRQQVGRCLRVAREICGELSNGDTTITPEFWRGYFELVDADPFKSGRQRGGNGHENWTPDFEYLTREKTMLDVYDRSGAGEQAA